MVELTPLGSEFEAVIAAVLLFLLSGLFMFFCCFVLTHIYLFYKRRIQRKKGRERHEEKDTNSTFNYAPLQTELTIESTETSSLSNGHV
uniref:Uncharacterized protein n=1 Tax=Panagrolaimus sp. ES5 TaxID=591445 RepID=A0AC34G9K4_9BILA